MNYFIKNQDLDLFASFSFDSQFKVPGPEDLSSYIVLDQEEFPQPWTEKGWKDSFFPDSGLPYILIGKRNPQDQLIAFALFHLSPIEELAHLLKILIHPSGRRRRLGQSLMKASIEILKSKRFKKIYLDVESSNPARRFYKALGFQYLNLRKDFYGQGRDSYSMLLSI